VVLGESLSGARGSNWPVRQRSEAEATLLVIETTAQQSGVLLQLCEMTEPVQLSDPKILLIKFAYLLRPSLPAAQ
jgi:hypothetical protein